MTHHEYVYNKNTGVAVQKINWHPFAANPLDYMKDGSLRTPDGDKVKITKDSRGTGFTVFIGDTVYRADGNSAVCDLLYRQGVGRVVE
jgi:hypothetical protein